MSECPYCWTGDLTGNHCENCNTFLPTIGKVNYKEVSGPHDDPHAPEYNDDEP